MPYIYSLAFWTEQTGAPFMRALWMDFSDGKSALTGDEFMFGPALLVAPVTEQGAVSREVYLPEGTKWYDFWTDEKLDGGQTITVDAPIEKLPLFVKEGSLLPLGEVLPNSKEEQTDIDIQIYPGKDASFSLYSDDGASYAYEEGEYSLVKLIWEEGKQELSVTEEQTSEKLRKKNYRWTKH